MDKKKTIIVVVAVVAVIAIAISVILLTKNTDTVYTISFDTNGGTQVGSQKVEGGKNVTKPTNPTREGYEFLGWYLNGVEYDFKTPVEGDLKIEAIWKQVIVDDDIDVKDEENKVDEEEKQEEKEDEEEKEEVTKYTVKFDSKGGSKVASKTVEKDKTVKQPADPTKEGYIFKGWFLESTKYNFSKKVTKNITLTAKWEKVSTQQPEEEKPNVQPEEQEKPEVKEYTVKFDVDGSVISTKTVKEGEKVNKPTNPTKSGYTFKYWTLNGVEYNFSSEVKNNITLKAEWKKNDVISYKIEKVSNSVMNQVRVFITLNGEKVAGTADVVNTQGEKIKRDIPLTGWLTFAGTVEKLENIKVK